MHTRKSSPDSSQGFRSCTCSWSCRIQALRQQSQSHWLSPSDGARSFASHQCDPPLLKLNCPKQPAHSQFYVMRKPPESERNRTYNSVIAEVNLMHGMDAIESPTLTSAVVTGLSCWRTSFLVSLSLCIVSISEMRGLRGKESILTAITSNLILFTIGYAFLNSSTP